MSRRVNNRGDDGVRVLCPLKELPSSFLKKWAEWFARFIFDEPGKFGFVEFDSFGVRGVVMR